MMVCTGWKGSHVTPTVAAIFVIALLGMMTSGMAYAAVSLDRTVYPVPFDPSEYGTATDKSLADYDVSGDLVIHIRVNDPDFDVSAAGKDTIVNASEYLTVTIIRGAESTTIDLNSVDITEVAPDAGVFELDLTISHNVGGDIGQIQQGDIIQVEYEDPTDASGEINTVTDSATFDLRNAVLQSDKSVYIIGSDMILTLIEPDFDLDNDGAETYPLDLIEWDSDAATVAMGSDPALDPEPNGLHETGDSTGIFQSIIEIPGELEGDRLERGEEIELEYVDYGPSGSDYVGDETEDITLTVFTSNFGATIELDQKVYTWTDKVYITIVAPDHNFDSALVDEIGESDDDPIRISTRSDDIYNYKLVETGADTGIFTGEIILIGFDHNADGETTTGTTTTGYDNPQRETSGSDSGPTNGYIKTDDDDGITVSFEFSEDETVVGSALIRWNIGEVQWLEASYSAFGTGIVRVIDPDMNWNPEAVDNFEVDVWSDTHAGGIGLTVTETGMATGVFEGVVSFTTADPSSGHRLHVRAGDIVTARYEDNTLPDPYTTADELYISATARIDGTAREQVATAQIELDQGAYTWTDKVHITVTAPDHNLDSFVIDDIGESDDYPVSITTRKGHIDNYRLVETGADTGMFAGTVTLIGFDHNADGNTSTGTEAVGYDNPRRETGGSGPTDGYIKSGSSDGITVSFKVSRDETIVSSALIRWNIGSVQWQAPSYAAHDVGIVRVIDSDMNLDPYMIDSFEVDVWSDTDAGGTDLFMTETGPATGIFEGAVFFTATDESSGHRLRVAEGDMVWAEYEDNTLPDPYTTADELDVTATTLIDSIIPHLTYGWSIGEIQWVEDAYSAHGIGVVRVTDPDMNWHHGVADVFEVDVWSDSDRGANVLVTETGPATGIFEGTAFVAVGDHTSYDYLRVSEGDTISAAYDDYTVRDSDMMVDEIDIITTAQAGPTELINVTMWVESFTPNHISTFGSRGDDVGQFTTPTYTTSNNTHLFVTQDDRHYVQVFHTNGTFADRLGYNAAGTADGWFDNPTGLAHNGTHLLVSDKNNHRVQIFDAAGRFAGKFDTHMGLAPYNIEVITTRIFVVGQATNQIQLFDASGNYSRTFGGSGPGDGMFGSINATATNSTHLFVLDSSRHMVQIFDAAGAFVAKFGSQGSGDGQFEIPTDIEHHNPLFVSDAGRGDVQIFDTAGQFIGKFGGQDSGDSGFASPAAITTTRTQLFVMDTERNVMQSFSFFEPATVAAASLVPSASTEPVRICR